VPVVRPTEVKPAHIREFVAELIDRTSPGNAHTNYRRRRTFFRWLVEEDEIDRTPTDRTKAPLAPEKPAAHRDLMTVARPCSSPVAVGILYRDVTPRSSEFGAARPAP
jgi:site-specific recombinase XerC